MEYDIVKKIQEQLKQKEQETTSTDETKIAETLIKEIEDTSEGELDSFLLDLSSKRQVFFVCEHSYTVFV